MKFVLTKEQILYLSMFNLYNYNFCFSVNYYSLYLICVYLFVDFFIDFVINM